ncbi:thioesterase [Salipaludibacillus keqinensis]|uniref:Thioesterase n=1 Tax=Salipaludibacillus keqinensis TaxID=2045207 RepID=A0A323TGZ9_9BACI|nr:PaaI family thioesterase [Salipaludibacillus keqinensis]PYZ94098.1 thioesterase [Salipaludibacillus keqinensis]
MDEQKLTKRFEQALKDHKDGTPQLFLYSLMDFSFDYLEEEEIVELSAPISEVMYNPVGFIHGGIITYMADTAMGHLCAAFGERPSVSLELKTQFIKTAKTGELKAKAYFIKKGKQVQFVECMIHDEQNQLLSKVTGTFYTI